MESSTDTLGAITRVSTSIEFGSNPPRNSTQRSLRQKTWSDRCSKKGSYFYIATCTDIHARKICSCTETRAKMRLKLRRRSFPFCLRKRRTFSTFWTVHLRSKSQRNLRLAWSAGKKWAFRIATLWSPASAAAISASTRICISTRTCFSQLDQNFARLSWRSASSNRIE